MENTVQLTPEQVQHLMQEAYDLGVAYCHNQKDEVAKCKHYEDAKEVLDHAGAALNEIFAATMVQTRAHLVDVMNAGTYRIFDQ